MPNNSGIHPHQKRIDPLTPGIPWGKWFAERMSQQAVTARTKAIERKLAEQEQISMQNKPKRGRAA